MKLTCFQAMLWIGLALFDSGPQTPPRLVAQLEHAPPVFAVALSDDGKWLVTGNGDKTARLWDLSSGRQIRSFKGHTSRISALAISSDGKWLVTGSWDQTARLWELSSGIEIRRFQGHKDAITSVVLSGNGKVLITGSDDKTARLWDVSSGKEIRTVQGRNAVVCVALSYDGERLVLDSGNGPTIWEVASGQEVRNFAAQAGRVHSVALGSDGKWLVTGNADNTARLWELSTGKEIRRFRGHTDKVTYVALSSDRRRLATLSIDGTARIWETATGQEALCLPVQSEFFVNSAVLSRDIKWLLTGSFTGTAQLWSTWGPNCGKQVCQLLTFHDGTWAVTDPDGRYDASNGGDIEHLHWVVGMETFPLKKFADRYYDPGLLAKHLGLHKERPREVKGTPR